MKRFSRAEQTGFTLIELMIALIISLILLAGVLHIMLGNRNSLRAQNALAGLQARARLLNVMLDDAIAQAGYHVEPSQKLTNILKSDAAPGSAPTLARGSYIGAATTKQKTILRIRFQAAGGLHNCLGKKIGKTDNTVVSERVADFSLEYYISGTDKNQIKCHTYAPKDGTGYSITRPLLNNIRAFRTRFALDTDGDGSVDHYVDSLKPRQQRQILTLRIQALFQTRKRVLSTPISRSFSFVNGPDIDVNDSRRGFLFFDRTVLFRNARN
ncbi:prepilin-type N-terminal cleavage/methylation domain-containing protein [Salinisphaera orenii]|uniref:prepilin-type N-terminal cleavage/methylation domain-containing protein n=1 Tax=Salinisphaera orenii TaxID=856731 RepID=UPI000DBE1025